MAESPIILLKNMVEIPSVFPDESRIARYCADFLHRRGFKVELIPIAENRFNLVATKGNQNGHILLFGHLDTVPPYGYAGNPFRMGQKGDKITGLGSWDMKSGIAIILSAASNARLRNYRIHIVLTADEENISLGGHAIYSRNFLRNAVLGISPEIIDTTNIKKNAVLLGRRGRVVYQIDVLGVSGHGAALKGISAISVASRITDFVEKQQFKKDNFLGRTTIFVRQIQGASSSLSLPEKCSIILDVHYTRRYTKESLLKELESALRKKFSDFLHQGVIIKISIPKRITPYLEPYVTSVDKHVKNALDIISKQLNGISIGAGLTVADENIVGQFIPVITLGAEGGEAHSADEWVSKKSIIQIEKVYRKIIETLD